LLHVTVSAHRRDLHPFPTRRSSDLALNDADVPLDSVTRQAVPVTAATYELVKQGQLDGYIVSLETSIGIVNQNPDAVSSPAGLVDRKSTRLNSSHVKISYAVFCLKK